MLNCIFILSENYTHFKNVPAAHTGNRVWLSFLANAGDGINLQGAYTFFSRNNIENFSISFRINHGTGNSFLQDLVAFLFIPSYCSINGKLPINLICNDSSLFEQTRAAMVNFCGEQGIENLVVNHLVDYEPGYRQPENSPHPVSYLFNHTADLMTDYRSRLQSRNIYNNIFYLRGSGNERHALYEMAEQEEEKVKIIHPALYGIAVHIQSVLSENEYLKKKSSGMISELDNYKNHIAILRSSHQANELQQYYHNEYEVLPLWYKRFGHIIKVITGKRSFRSLFSDKIKKQND